MNLRRTNVGRFALALLLWATVAPVLAQTIWIDGTGDWFNAANWSAGVPDSDTNARINNGGTAQITASGAIGVVALGFGAQDSGALSVSGSGRLNGEVDVGVNGTGTLSITNGGVVTSSRFVMANEAGSHGSATVSGSGSRWTNNVVCFVGLLGTATLNITDGGQVSNISQVSIAESKGSVGMVTVDGAGSVWDLSASITVAGNGAGTLLVTNGGSVFSDDACVIGRNPGSNGVATINGPGSTWTTGGLSIGNGFDATIGALHITDGGAVSNSSNGLLGGLGGSGAATVDGVGSSWVNNGDLFLPGGNGGTAMLTIKQGGVVSSFDGYLGFGSPSSNGTAEVDGADSTWTNSGNLFVGGSESGAAGVGLLRLRTAER